MNQPVIVRKFLTATPERVYELFTSSSGLSAWFCDHAVSDVAVGGYVHAKWQDEDGEAWERLGTWTELDPPFTATLTWLGAQPGQAEAEPAPDDDQLADSFRFAIAPQAHGCVVTVLTPLPQTEVPVRADVLLDAIRQGWDLAFAELDMYLQQLDADSHQG